MALIKCVECKKEISDTVKKCPHCGYQIKPNLDLKGFIKRKKLFIVVLIVIIIPIIIIATYVSNTDENKFKRYLTNNGYTCEEDYYPIAQETSRGIFCKKGNYVYSIANYKLIYLYGNSVYILFTPDNYNNKYESIYLFDETDEILCRCQDDDRNVNIGTKLECRSSITDLKKYCKNKTELVNDIAREYERTFENAGIIEIIDR